MKRSAIPYILWTLIYGAAFVVDIIFFNPEWSYLPFLGFIMGYVAIVYIKQSLKDKKQDSE